MVNNLLKILDGGKLKFVCEIIEMKKPHYVYDFEDEIRKMNHLWNQKRVCGDVVHELIRFGRERTRQEAAYYEKCNEWNVKYGNNETLKYYLGSDCDFNTKFEFNKIAKYYNIEPFVPHVMINISPNWNGKIITGKINKLKKLINLYLQEGWYDRWSYVIENGSEGKHIHAHIVARMNPQRLKSVESHLRKNNHTRQLQKYSQKIEGMEGLIEGVSVQRILLRTETLVKDKLDYLIEERKPEGHKNKSVIEDGFVSGSL
jgi:hypothetical protein